MLKNGRILNAKINFNDAVFYLENGVILTLSFPEASIIRMRMSAIPYPRPSIMVHLGYVKEILRYTKFETLETSESYQLSTENLSINLRKKDANITLLDKEKKCFLKSSDTTNWQIGNGNLINFDMGVDEHFYGFDFQRKTLDARGHKLTFTRNYRWNEATVPFFLSTAGYGFFSANTFDHTFDFTKNNTYSILINCGYLDYFIFHGPSFKTILDQYTALTRRPIMPPNWSMGLCYIARYFENDNGLMDIARRFCEEGIPCDMLGLEPGWEEKDYSMNWIWSRNRFPEPSKMIKKLSDMGYKFELWESGEAPTEGYLDPEVRKKSFEKRVDASVTKGVAFYKQDDPYPRCITSTEMVAFPEIGVFTT